MPTPVNYCSHNSRDVSLENPIGSASGFSRNLLIEVPLPWERIPLETPHIPAELRDAITELEQNIGKTSVTLLVPDPGYAADGARLIDVQVVDGEVMNREIIATDGDLAAVVRSIARGETLPDAAYIDETPWRNIAVCTHGSGDVCCATFGFPMYLKMHAAARHLPNTRVWRGSHLGGHRFAPTMIDFSCGRSFGLVDEAAAKAILLQDTDIDELLPHYRGSVIHKDAELQMLEAEIFRRTGWSWNEWQQSARVLNRDAQGRGVKVEITGTHPEHGEITYRAEIAWGEEFTTIASCNAEPVRYIRKSLANLERIEPAIASIR